MQTSIKMGIADCDGAGQGRDGVRLQTSIKMGITVVVRVSPVRVQDRIGGW